MTHAIQPLPALESGPLVRASGLAYLVFAKKHLARQKKFMENFGLVPLLLNDDVLYMRGHDDRFYCYRCERGNANSLSALGFELGSEADLLAVAKQFNATVETLAWPEPHQRVTVTDPNGLRVELIWRPQAAARVPTLTSEILRPRGQGMEVRPPLQPSRVRRLGHVVLDVFDFPQSVRWYREHLGLLPSDVLCLDSGEPVVAFMRLDRGETPTEHHTLVLSCNMQVGCNHSAYQVSSLDDMAMGQQVLIKEGWRHLWGMGRHLLGSQIFDYWRDPSGEVVEHYLDSDHYTASKPTTYHRLSSEGLYQWGPNVPGGFGLPRLDLQKLKRLSAALWRGDVGLTRLLQMKKQMSAPAKPWL